MHQLLIHHWDHINVILGVEKCQLARLTTHGTESQVVGLNNWNYLCNLFGTVNRRFFMRKACLTTKVLQRFFQAGREITIEIDAIVTDFANFRRETFSLTFWRVCQLEI